MAIELAVADYLRFAGTGLSLTGTSILAFRVTGLLKALGEVAKIHEQNIKQLAVAVENPRVDLVYAVNSPKWIADAQRQWALWLGFFLTIFGGALQFASTIF
ncbi:hypothetical protein GCM10011402_31880 [Paracoccus acridae]|uniref:Uncharacterized protein n=1 Tax=Paracoccus acridae TaxID=1795310 RepID=A0ABQ1VL88_9RHOB|nr:hypothetical protein [Paracoccus acridae]GGF76739.1 hypothetical protein GCM10011402_31880 [Paracoccus acridae]